MMGSLGLSAQRRPLPLGRPRLQASAMEALFTFAVVLLIAIALLSVLAKRRGVDDNFVRRVDRWRVRYWTRHRTWPGSKRDPLVRLTRRRSPSWSDDSGPS